MTRQFQDISIFLKFRILDFIKSPKIIKIICQYDPKLTENALYWQKRYQDFFREFTDLSELIDIEPRVVYQAYIVRSSIVYDVHYREKQLRRALNKVGLYIRNDSKLCHNWIRGLIEPKWVVPEGGVAMIKRPWTLDAVVMKCIEMRWLFDYCDFKFKLHDYLNGHNLTYNDETFSQACRHFLELYPVPKALPWLFHDDQYVIYAFDSSDTDSNYSDY